MFPVLAGLVLSIAVGLTPQTGWSNPSGQLDPGSNRNDQSILYRRWVGLILRISTADLQDHSVLQSLEAEIANLGSLALNSQFKTHLVNGIIKKNLSPLIEEAAVSRTALSKSLVNQVYLLLSILNQPGWFPWAYEPMARVSLEVIKATRFSEIVELSGAKPAADTAANLFFQQAKLFLEGEPQFQRVGASLVQSCLEWVTTSAFHTSGKYMDKTAGVFSSPAFIGRVFERFVTLSQSLRPEQVNWLAKEFVANSRLSLMTFVGTYAHQKNSEAVFEIFEKYLKLLTQIRPTRESPEYLWVVAHGLLGRPERYFFTDESENLVLDEEGKLITKTVDLKSDALKNAEEPIREHQFALNINSLHLIRNYVQALLHPREPLTNKKSLPVTLHTDPQNPAHFSFYNASELLEREILAIVTSTLFTSDDPDELRKALLLSEDIPVALQGKLINVLKEVLSKKLTADESRPRHRAIPYFIAMRLLEIDPESRQNPAVVAHLFMYRRTDFTEPGQFYAPLEPRQISPLVTFILNADPDARFGVDPYAVLAEEIAPFDPAEAERLHDHLYTNLTTVGRFGKRWAKLKTMVRNCLWKFRQ